jgi:hypothetical protein
MAAVELPIGWSFFDGIAGSHGYNSLSIDGATAIGIGEITCGEVRVVITNDWSVEETVRLRRQVQTNPVPGAINLALEASIEIDDSRPLAPGKIYSPTQWRRGEKLLFADHRLAYPIASVWSPTQERLFWLARTRPAERDEPAERMRAGATTGNARNWAASDSGSTMMAGSSRDGHMRKRTAARCLMPRARRP